MPPNSPRKKRTKGFLFGVVALVIVLALGAGGAWFVMNERNKAEVAEADMATINAAKIAINEIGDVDLDDTDRIAEAEKRYSEVRVDARDQVTNYSTLTAAKTEVRKQQLQLDSVQKDVDAWAKSPTCAVALELEKTLTPLNPSQLSRVKKKNELTKAIALCIAEAKQKSDREAEEQRRQNLVKVSNYWWTNTGTAAKGCRYEMAPEFTNLTKTETITTAVFNVSFYNAKNARLNLVTGQPSIDLAVKAKVPPGGLNRSVVSTVNVDCSVQFLRINTVALTYASGKKDSIVGAELQFGKGWGDN